MADTSAIHDIGYQRYQGERLGRGYARQSLYVHGVRTVFGLGRSGKAKIFPWFVGSVLLLVAIILVAIRSQTGVAPTSYVDFPQQTSVLILLFLAIAAPELVSRDLRSKTLPLYFSRPVTRTDYAVAKVASLISAVFLIILVPLTVLFLGGAFSLPAHEIWHEFTLYLRGLASAAIIAIVFSVVALLIASLLSRRMVAAAAIVGTFLVLSTVGGVITVIGGSGGEKIGRLVGPQLIVQSLSQWMLSGDPKHYGHFGWVYLFAAALLTGVCALLLLVRYRRVAA